MAESRSRLDAAGIVYRRLPACDWNRLSPSQLREVSSDRRRLFAKARVTPGEIACFLSHVRAWEVIAAGEARCAIVLEDDFELQPEALAIMRRLAEVPANWDMLKFYTDRPRTMLKADDFGENHIIGLPHVLPPTTVAYAITRPAAKALAAMSLPIARPIDLYLKHWWEHDITIKVLQPAIVLHRENHASTSSLTESRKAGRPNPLLRFFRNGAYQFAFRLQMWRHASRRRVEPRWRDVDPGDGQT